MLAVLLAATLGYNAPIAAAAAPPAGTYRYVETVKGRPADVSTIELKYAGPSIFLKEETKPQDERSFGAYVLTHTSFDSSSLEMLGYHAEVAVGCSALEYDIDVNGQSARVGKKWLTFPGVTHFVVDNAQALPIMLPAQIQAWHDIRAAIVAPQTALGYVAQRDPLTETPARPATVPAGDTYIAMRSPGHPVVGIWYDPKTLVVDQFTSGDTLWQRVESR
jgi:hypothetical protein